MRTATSDRTKPLPTARKVPASIDGFFPYLLNQITSRINDSMRAALRPMRMSVPQWRVLIGLALKDGRSIGDLIAFTVMAQSTVSRVVDQMERDQLVRRRPRVGNRRIVQVYLTPKGRETFRKLWPIANSINQKSIRNLSPSEAARLASLLNRVLATWK